MMRPASPGARGALARRRGDESRLAGEGEQGRIPSTAPP